MENSAYLTTWIGTKIKDIRKSNHLKLGDLADKSGISIAMLSKIENGRVFPTLPTLIQVLNTLNVDLNVFFSDLQSEKEFPGYLLKRKDEYRSVKKEEEAIGFDDQLILNHKMERSSMEISLLTISGKSQRERVTTDGFEYLYVINGSIKYELGENTFDLEEGDSLFFNGNISHLPINSKKTDAQLLVIYFIEIR
ncbi:helix-turn-helix domain-containing protein [Cyclobacterium qasimii]|uniref:Transcriptional regulator, XRE family protein n=2 Tax=Cyclobacterium qasimii TaxID=1350429 RepID=S7WZL4_9BACT|nr:XRE family transcriptional regulator [Cyclobacterium qasimii]EPR69343.1 transcriptional regulator, XRE family protein [Cyclobacterium qasimii M12-11B]GEO22832.1 DNA-binding protein [Cyclobacterium qasimii]